jgi:gamma-glutamyl:cysteine ligase YbdK (ATP-grasp superfamily)
MVVEIPILRRWIMSLPKRRKSFKMKRFAEAVSVQMGYEGEINDFVLKVTESMFPQAHKLGFENGCTLEEWKDLYNKGLIDEEGRQQGRKGESQT